MKEQMTAKVFRDASIQKFEETRKIVDKHYELLWEISKDFIKFGSEPFRVETIYGDFTFTPNLKFLYGNN